MLGLNSQEVDIASLSYKEVISLIDETIDSKDEVLIDYLASMGLGSPHYSNIEKYILSEVRRLVGGEDLGYPLKLVEAILYNNLENSDAQELYGILINKKIELDERREAEIIKAEKKREEIKKLADQIDKTYKEEERLAEIVTSNQELLSTINGYIDSFDKTHYVSNSYYYPLLTRFYESEVYDGFHNRAATVNSHSGFAMDLGIGVELKMLTLRADLTGSFSFNELLHDNIKQLTGAFNISTGLSIIPFPLYFRGGFLYDMYLYDNMDDTEVAITNLPSPSLGLGISGLKLFKVIKLDLSTDILLAAVYTDNLSVALFNRAYISLNLFRFGTYNMEIRGGLDYLYYSEGGLAEYSLTPRFGMGISSYE